MLKIRACLKKAFRELRVPVCGRFYPNEGGVAGYGNRMRVKYTAKWGLQIAEMIFQTRSKLSVHLSIADDSKWDGLKGYLTNTDIPIQDVYTAYHNLWHVERAFRIAKSKIEIRPMFHFTRKRIVFTFQWIFAYR